MIFNSCLTEEDEWNKLADATIEAIRAALEKTERKGKNKRWTDYRIILLKDMKMRT